MTRLPAVAILAGVLIVVAACGDAVRQSRASSYLIIENLTAASGANTLQSNIASGGLNTEDDIGKVNLKLAMKNPGSIDSPAAPTSTNEITIYRYRVVYTRADGKNTAGVDVPYSFDGAATATVTDVGTSLTFVLVRAKAKDEPPLRGLGSVQLATIAQVTFYGRDQAGNETSVTGSISVDFIEK